MAAINRWRAEGGRLARQSQQLRQALAHTTATAADEYVQVQVSASGALLAIGFTKACQDLSRPQLANTLLRVYAAAKALLVDGDGLTDGRDRPIRVALSPEDDDPAFATTMAKITLPAGTGLPTAPGRAEMIRRVRQLNQTGPTGLGLRGAEPPAGQSHDQWMRERLTRVAEQAAQHARRLTEIVGHAASDCLTIEVDHLATPLSVRFHSASSRLDPEQLGTEFVDCYTEAFVDARGQADAIRSEQP